ncbi:hypothetical protein ACFLXA_01680 [Chloroflexota bacterium]
MKSKEKLGTFKCSCGSMAGLFVGRKGYYSHCLHCGAMAFFNNETIVERIKAGATTLCGHKIELKDCKGGGKTGWCHKCRVRIFIPTK